MTPKTVADLAKDLEGGRMVRDLPPALLLGAGSAVGAGIPAMGFLLPAFECKTLDQFFGKIGPLTSQQRFRQLFRFLQTNDPFTITPGYQALAALIFETYFDLILTTNFDPLLEDALVAARMRRKDYLLLINGVIDQSRVNALLLDHEPRVKLIKLHGDLFHRLMAWTPTEMDGYLNKIGPKLNAILKGRDLIVVGHGLQDSPRISKLASTVLKAGRAVWYANLKTPPPEFASNAQVQGMIGKEFAFEMLFPALAAALGVDWMPKPAAAAPPASQRAQSVDDLMSSVVKVMLGDTSACTGFILSNPRVIVSDGFNAQFASGNKPVSIVTSDGQAIKVKTIKLTKSHAFGPWILEAPASVKAPGLMIDAKPVTQGLAIRTGVAVGTGVGVSSGRVRSAKEISAPIAPIPGIVKHLIDLECAVAPGSSGAPVVDSDFKVRGFIVAGKSDAPESYMYPASRWAAAISGS